MLICHVTCMNYNKCFFNWHVCRNEVYTQILWSMVKLYEYINKNINWLCKLQMMKFQTASFIQLAKNLIANRLFFSLLHIFLKADVRIWGKIDFEFFWMNLVATDQGISVYCSPSNRKIIIILYSIALV